MKNRLIRGLFELFCYLIAILSIILLLKSLFPIWSELRPKIGTFATFIIAIPSVIGVIFILKYLNFKFKWFKDGLCS